MRYTQHDFIYRHFGITGITDSACSNTKQPNWKSKDEEKKPAARPKKARVSPTDRMSSLENNVESPFAGMPAAIPRDQAYDTSNDKDEPPVDNVVPNLEQPAVQEMVFPKGLNMSYQTFSSKGYTFALRIPDTHTIISRHEKKRLQNRSKVVTNVWKQFQRGRTPPDTSNYMRAVIACGLAASLTIPLSTLSGVMPSFVGGMLVDTHVLHLIKFNLEKFCKSFPGDTWMRNILYGTAIECLLLLAMKLVGKIVTVACDKGNKKGLDHFVKLCSNFDMASRQVVSYLLDIDVSLGTNKACADAVECSLGKEFCGADHDPSNFLLGAVTTDSCDGGTLDGV